MFIFLPGTRSLFVGDIGPLCFPHMWDVTADVPPKIWKDFSLSLWKCPQLLLLRWTHTNSLNYVPIMPICATPSQLTDFTESAI